MQNPYSSLARRLGVTRLADVTGLDRVGLPVMAAVRPLSRNVSVHFGKGVDREAARLSALMEAAELHFSERCHLPWEDARFAELDTPALDPNVLEHRQGVGDAAGIRYHWVRGQSLATGQAVLVPWECVSMDYRADVDSNFATLARGPTGLAAHFDQVQALLHGLHEVIERDSHDRWNHASDEAREASLVDRNSITDEHVHNLLERLEHAGLEVLFWDMTGPCGIPCYLAEVMDPQAEATTAYAQGAAAHGDPHVALFKALCEAVQVRLTYISGARDDLDWCDYGGRYAAMVENRLEVCADINPTRKLPQARRAMQLSPETELQHLLTVLPPGGVFVLLTPPGEDIRVVKVIVPELQDMRDVAGPAAALVLEDAL